MAEALWVQASGVDYSAAEDRRLISAMYTPGVLNGLTVAAATGLAVSVSAGKAIISDGGGGAYLAYWDTDSTVAGLPANTTCQLWATVNTTNGQATIGGGTTVPTQPYVLIGSVVTGAAGVSSVSNARAQSQPPVVAQPMNYLPITGGTLTGSGELTANRVRTPGADMALDINFPFGARLGGSNRTAKHGCRVLRTSAQQIPNATWTGVRFGTQDYSFSTYGTETWRFPPAGNTTSGTFFFVPVPGDYALSGQAFFDPNSLGTRRGRIRQFLAAGTHVWTKYTAQNPSVDSRLVTWDTTLHVTAPDTFFVFEVYQDSGAALNLEYNASHALGIAPYASTRLIQAD